MVKGLGFNYYGVLISVLELIYDKSMSIMLFKCKWFSTDPTRRRSTIIDRGLLSVDSNNVWYENEPFILATMAKQVFYLDDLAMGEATLGGDDESGPSELTTDPPNEAYQEKYPHVVPDTEDIRVNNQHIQIIIGYIPVTPFELNSLQHNPNHDDDDFIDDEYIEDDENFDQTEEDDDSDD
ncbi:hypothetical protein ACLB2K_042768 [Fragaria x ananassa]